MGGGSETRRKKTISGMTSGRSAPSTFVETLRELGMTYMSISDIPTFLICEEEFYGDYIFLKFEIRMN